MKKFALALALGAGLAAAHARAASLSTTFTTLGTTNLDAGTFNNLFTPVNTASLSPFQFADSSTPSGMIESQVFKYNGTTADGNPLYAYAYQVGVAPTPAGGDPAAHVDSLSFKFNATGLAADPNHPTNTTYGYIVTNGKVGGLDLPGTQIPTSLTFQPDAATGYIRAQYVDPTTGTTPVSAGANSATFVLLSNQPPATTMPSVNVGGPEATVGIQKAYVPQPGAIQPAPVPEPATVLAWAGVLGAVALARRARKTRAAVA
jgi:hypothetical protein